MDVPMDVPIIEMRRMLLKRGRRKTLTIPKTTTIPTTTTTTTPTTTTIHPMSAIAS